MPSWQGFEEFVQVVNSGSFSAAAQVLGVSKAHVSQQVSRLEDRLGSRLLHRTTRKLSLTETGESYYLRCQQIIDDLNAAEQSVKQLQERVEGSLTISAPHLLGETLLVPAIAEFLQLHPGLKIDLNLSSRRINLLDEHCDIAIQVGERRDVNVVNKILAKTRFFVVASPDYLAKHPAPKTPDDIYRHSSLLFCQRGESKPWKFCQLKGGAESPERQVEEKSIRLSSHWRSNSGHALRAAAKQGLGLAYLPDYYLAEDVASGRLKIVLQNWSCIDRELVAIYQHKRHLSAKIRTFTEFLCDYFSSQSHHFQA